MFYITLRDGAMAHLDTIDTVIGQVAEGTQVLDRLSSAPVDDTFRPLQLLRIQRADIVAGQFVDAHLASSAA
jgi:cyclophilin family peptidyl-prolyl cis-trans isomerase